MKKIIGMIAVASLVACGGESKQDGAKVLANLNTSMSAASSAVASGHASAARDSTGTVSFSGSCASSGTFAATLSGQSTNRDSGTASVTYVMDFTNCTLADKSVFNGKISWIWSYGGTSTTTGGTTTAGGTVTYGYIADDAGGFSYTDAQGKKHTIATNSTGITVATTYQITATGTSGTFSIVTTVNGAATIDGTLLTYTNDQYTVSESGSY